MLRVYKDNLNPSVTDTISVGGTPVDLTNATGVKFRMRSPNSNTLTVDATAAVTSAVNGAVQYNWQAADVDTAGPFVGWWSVTWSGARVQDTPEFDIEIAAHGAANTDLCAVWDVRLAMKLPATDTSRDPQIQEYITQASAQIIDYTQREFAPASTGLTRRFVWKNGRVDFAPYDLRTVTSVVISPEEQINTLDVLTDVDLRPTVSPYGVYSSMKISPWIPQVDTRFLRFGKSYVDVTGDWGFASVPVPVKRACVIAVQSWLRRDTNALAGAAGAALAGGTGQGEPTPQGTFYLPYASCKLLDPYARFMGII